MKTTSLTKLKSSLSEYLARVKAGDEVLITERGRAIAKIIPLKKEDRPDSDRALALERAGVARIGKRRLPKNFWESPRPAVTGSAALEALLKDREEGR